MCQKYSPIFTTISVYTFCRHTPYRQVPAKERVYDERLVAQVDDAGDAVARLQGRHRPRHVLPAGEVLHGAMVVAMLHILQRKKERKGSMFFIVNVRTINLFNQLFHLPKNI